MDRRTAFRRRLIKVTLCLFATFAIQRAPHADEIIWASAGSGTYSSTANWVGGVVPTSSDTVAFKGWAPLSRSGWTVTASATFSGYPSSNTVDGRPSTLWMNGANQASGVWVKIDMGATQTFGGIDLDCTNSHNTDYPRAFDVYVSSDGTNWGSAIKSDTSSTALTETRFSDQSARYIKIQLTTSAANWWTIEEIRVWGTAGDTQFATNGMTITASSTGDGSTANTIDWSNSTVWSPGVAQANGQWLKADLGANRTFTAITLDAYSRTGDYPRGYNVEVSTNNSTWTSVATGSPSAEYVHITFAAQTARYVRVTQTGSTSGWWSVYEFHIYGTPSTCTTASSITLAGINHANAVTFAQGSGYTLTVTGNWSQSAGTFTGGNSQISVSGDLNLSGGAFTSTSGLLKVTGAFNNTGTTFTHNSGRVMLSASSDETFATNSTTFYDLIVNDGLVGYWKFDEGSGSTFNDYSGYAFNGTLTNSPTWSAGPTLNFTDSSSLTVNGTTQYGRVGRSTVMEPTAVTISAWIKRNGTQTQFGKVVSKTYSNDGASPYASYEMQMNPSGSDSTRVGLITGHSGPNYDILQSATNALPDATWTHVAMIDDPAGSPTKRIYVNGALNASSSSVSSAMLYDTSSSGDLWFGQGGGNAQYYKGSMDEIRIYDRALTANEIYSLYSGTQPGTTEATQTMTGSPTVAGDLTLASGALSVGSNNMTVTGDWNNYGGLFSAGTGTVTLNSTSASTTIRSAGQPFYNVTLNGSGGTWTLHDWIKVGGNLAFTNGTLTPGSYIVHAGGMTKTSGALTTGTGTVVLDTTADSSESTGFSFYNLRVETPDETNLVGYWKFDEGQGTVVRDASGTGNHGTLTSGTRWLNSSSAIATTLFDNRAAVNFTGTSSYATLGTTSLPANNAAQSISLWINSGTNSGGSDHYIFSLWNASSSGVSIGIHNTGVLGVWKWGATLLASTTAPSTGAWHHVVYTYNGTTHTLYLDGASVNTSTTAANTLSPTNAQVGTYNGISLYTGSVDDLRVYTGALTAAQVANLYAGRYAGTGGTTTVTLGANATVTNALTIDSGTLATSSYTMNASSASNVVTVNSSGTYQVGSATQTMAGGLTVVNGGTLSMPTSGGTVDLGNLKTLTMNGTLSASSTGAIITSSAGTYNFRVGTVSGERPTLNITGLQVKKTTANGMYINYDTGAITTFTRFDNIAFSSGAGTSAGNYNLRIYATSLNLAANGCTFDNGVTATVANNVKLAGNGTGDGETRALFGNATCASNQTSCEAYDADDDNAPATPNGVGETAGDMAVIQWIKGAMADTAGTIEGFPAPAFDWSAFTYYSTYVAMHDVSGTTDRVYVRDTNGNAKYYWSTSSGEDLIGAPRFDTVSSVHYVYVATTGGKVYRLIDNTVAQTLTADTVSPWDGANNPFDCSCTITTPLAHDTSNLYFGGNVSGTHKLFTLSKTSSSPRQPAGSPLATTTTTSNAAPAIWTSGSTYAFLGLAGRVSKVNVSTQANTADNTNPGSTNAVTGRISVINSKLYAGDDNGRFWCLDPGANFGTSSGLYKNWSYNDATNHASCGGVCQLKSHYFDFEYTRLYTADQDGHLYVLDSAGAIVTGYPYQPGSSSDAFATAPFYRGGVIVAGTTTGTLYVIDQSTNGTVPGLIQTYKFGSANLISGVGYDSNSGSYMVSTANATNKDGKLYYITASSDPTNSFR